MILEFTHETLKRYNPRFFYHLPKIIQNDNCYIFRHDTVSGLWEYGYRSDPWILK